MPKQWDQLTDSDLLDYEGTSTAIIARYERIMRNRTNYQLSGLQHVIHEARKALSKELSTRKAADAQRARQERRHNHFIATLTLVIAASTVAYTWTTWQSVLATNQANELLEQQVMLLEKQIDYAQLNHYERLRYEQNATTQDESGNDQPDD